MDQLLETSQHEHHGHEVEVHVKSLKTNDKTQFDVPFSTTLQQVWDEALDPEHLDEQRTPGDTFRCADGVDLMSRLAETLEQLAQAGLCPNRHFQIRGPSGGA